jgi:hypothetical protein
MTPGVARNVVAVMDAGGIGVNIEDGIDPATNALRPARIAAERIAAIRAVANTRGVPLFINARSDVYFLPARILNVASRRPPSDWHSMRGQERMARSYQVGPTPARSHGLRAGDLGAVVEIYGEHGLEVEFVQASGQTKALVTVRTNSCATRALTDGTREVKLYHLPNDHSSGMLVAYVPHARVRFTADLVSDIFPLIPPFASRVHELIQDNGLSVEMIACAHGNAMSYAQFPMYSGSKRS